MFGARASRIAQSSQTRNSTPSASNTRRRNAPEWLLHKWRQMTMKISLVLCVFTLKNSAITVLGRGTYNRIFCRQKEIQERAPASQPSRRVHRMIRGEAEGKELKKGSGTPTVEASMCEHPESAMKRGANDNRRSGGGIKWWTCDRCKSRWERIPCQEVQTQMGEDPTDSSVLLQGKYQGHTYQEVYTQDWEYCQWILTTASQEATALPWVNHFAQYLVSMMQVMEEDPHQMQVFPDWDVDEDLIPIQEEDPLL